MTKQRREVIKILQDNLLKGQTWAAFYDAQYRVAKGLFYLNVIEYDTLTGVFNLPGTYEKERPDFSWDEE